MPTIYYTCNGDHHKQDIKEIDYEHTIEQLLDSQLALEFLVQDITEVEYEDNIKWADEPFECIDISLWNSKKTCIVGQYIGFVKFKPYFVARKKS